MRLARLLSRSTQTAIKLPFAMTWDAISLGNMGDGTSTGKVLREHEARKHDDEVIETAKEIIQILKER